MKKLRLITVILGFILLTSFQNTSDIIYDGTKVEFYLMDKNYQVLEEFPVGLSPRVIRNDFFKSWIIMYKGKDGSEYHKFEFVATSEDGKEIVQEKLKYPSSSKNINYTSTLVTNALESSLYLVPTKFDHTIHEFKTVMVIRVSGLQMVSK